MQFDLTPDVHVRRDQDGKVRQLRHVHKPYTVHQAGLTATGTVTPRALAEQYLRDIATLYELPTSATANFAAAIAPAPTTDPVQLRFKEEKSLANNTMIAYAQTVFGLPVWDAGVAVRLNSTPLQVTSSHNAMHYGLADIQKPPENALYLPNRLEPAKLKSVLGITEAAKDPPVNATRLLIYRYEPEQRLDPQTRGQPGTTEGQVIQLPSLAPLLPPPAIQAGSHYLVTEVLFDLALPGWEGLHWRAFLDPVSGAVLYLRALIACASGRVFLTDPVTQTGTLHTAATPPAVLDTLRTSVLLLGLVPPADPATLQELKGEFVQLRDTDPPATTIPTRPEPYVFDYSSASNDFSAVSAYHHCDGVYRLMQGMGINLAEYFDGTSFPVPVDPHAWDWPGFGGSPVNAAALGNAAGNGMGRFIFGKVQSGQTMGIAADVRVVIHEFGHALLWDHVNSPNFGFAHSAGDSLGAILHDPDSKAQDRFESFPFLKASSGLSRRHDRNVANGWAWGGQQDINDKFGPGYLREQILSTTLFRVYRAAGGDAADLSFRRFTARYVAYLIIKAIGLLSFTTPDPDVFVTALIEADSGTVSLEGLPGGTLSKLIRWSFEQQGLYQPPGVPTPVAQPGAPPDVDVYFDDGRNGGYMPYLTALDQTPASAVWNRTTADGFSTDQTPVVGTTNYLYAVVRNRGTQTAQNVRVRAFQAKQTAPETWPGHFKPMNTPVLTVPSGIPAGGSAMVGPFPWVPEFAGQSVLLSANADGDRSSAETVLGSVATARLIPLDNNLALRKLVAVSAAVEFGMAEPAVPLAEGRAQKDRPYRDLLWYLTPLPGQSKEGETLLRVLADEEEIYRLPSEEPGGTGYTVRLPRWRQGRTTGTRREMQPVSQEEARSKGQELYVALPEKVVAPLLGPSDDGRPWRLKITSTAPQVTDLPWEWLSDGKGQPLALRNNVRLTRCVPVRFQTPPLTAARPLQVLLILTNPKDERLLNPTDEINAVTPGLVAPNYNLSICMEPTLEAVRTHLKAAPHIVHYIGHAGIENAEGNLIVHDALDRTYWMDGSEVALMLPSSVRLICLSTCFTAPNYQVLGLPRFAHAPPEIPLPTMVTNRYDVGGESVKVFWKAFYSALVKHQGNVNEAVHVARQATAAVQAQSADWASFALVLRDQIGESLRLAERPETELAHRNALEFQAQYSARIANELAVQIRLLGPAAPSKLLARLTNEEQRVAEVLQRLADLGPLE
jgi:hypothetical protein